MSPIWPPRPSAPRAASLNAPRHVQPRFPGLQTESDQKVTETAGRDPTQTELAMVKGLRRRTCSMFEAEATTGAIPERTCKQQKVAAVRERDEILAEGERFRAELRKWNWAELRRESVDEAAMALARRRIIKLLDEYVAWLPEVPVSRCPDSGDIVLWRLDNVDLNGWFWEYDNPARRPTKPPVSWLAMTGALRIAGPVASAPFIADPGPETPFVIPRILDKPGVRAVVAQLPIGPHVGWPITYFGPRPGVTLVNEWGANTYPVLDRGEWLGWAESTPWSPDNDYDLRPWLSPVNCCG